MRGRTIILVVSSLFAGCSFSGLPAEGNAGDDDVDGSIVVPKDSDGDGFFDADDDCPTVVDPDQRDHDGDHRGDACDVCPHLVDDGKDQDSDGVGDLCDPRPTEPGDRIAYFEGFYGSVAWRPVIGANTWTFASGTANQPSTADAYQLIRDDNPDLDNVVVEARVQIHQITGSTGTRRSTGIVTGYRDNDNYWFCGIAAPDTASEVNAGKVTWHLFGDTFDFNLGAFPVALPGDYSVLRARTKQAANGDTTIDCEVERGGVSGSASFTTTADASGDVGLRTNGAAASFDYVFVVAVPRP